MNKLVINKPSIFVNTFLNCITKVTEDCIVQVTENTINCLSCTPDGTLVQFVELNNTNNFTQTLNVPDIKRLHKIIGCVSDSERIELNVDCNSIAYKSPTTRFKFYLLEDGILTTPAISVDKIKSLTFDVSFNIPYNNIIELIKGSTFSNETEKLYIYTDENNNLYGELTDREKPNVDSFSTRLINNSLESSLSPTAFNFENIRILSGTRCDYFNCELNTQLGVMKVSILNDECNITYIVSALLK